MTDQPYITCRELIGFIMDYTDRTLDPEQRREFDRHLTVCPSCVNYLKSYVETIRLGKAACGPPDGNAAGTVPEGLLNAIRAARAKARDSQV